MSEMLKGSEPSNTLLEGTTVNKVRPSCAALNGAHNPFFGRYPRAQVNSQAQVRRPSPSPAVVTKDMKTAPGASSIATSSPGSTHPCTIYPLVVSPYIIELNQELEGNFELMNDQVPPLPCEVQELECELGPRKARWQKTVVLDLDETLICSVESNEGEEEIKHPQHTDHVSLLTEDGTTTDIEFLKRPRLDEFLHTLAHYFEIIVYIILTPRSFRLGRRSTRDRYVGSWTRITSAYRVYLTEGAASSGMVPST